MELLKGMSGEHGSELMLTDRYRPAPTAQLQKHSSRDFAGMGLSRVGVAHTALDAGGRVEAVRALRREAEVGSGGLTLCCDDPVPGARGGSDGERQEDVDVLGETFRDAVHAAEAGASFEDDVDHVLYAVKVGDCVLDRDCSEDLRHPEVLLDEGRVDTQVFGGESGQSRQLVGMLAQQLRGHGCLLRGEIRQESGRRRASGGWPLVGGGLSQTLDVHLALGNGAPGCFNEPRPRTLHQRLWVAKHLK